MKRAVVVLAALALVYGTVLVFLAFDRVSHSNSDTLRPFIITMLPVWVLSLSAARIVWRSGAH